MSPPPAQYSSPEGSVLSDHDPSSPDMDVFVSIDSTEGGQTQGFDFEQYVKDAEASSRTKSGFYESTGIEVDKSHVNDDLVGRPRFEVPSRSQLLGNSLQLPHESEEFAGKARSAVAVVAAFAVFAAPSVLSVLSVLSAPSVLSVFSVFSALPVGEPRHSERLLQPRGRGGGRRSAGRIHQAGRGSEKSPVASGKGNRGPSCSVVPQTRRVASSSADLETTRSSEGCEQGEAGSILHERDLS